MFEITQNVLVAYVFLVVLTIGWDDGGALLQLTLYCA